MILLDGVRVTPISPLPVPVWVSPQPGTPQVLVVPVIGPQGPAGDASNTGAQGPPGPAGPQGPTGVSAARRFYGVGPPTVVIGASIGDEYLDGPTGDLYVLQTGA